MKTKTCTKCETNKPVELFVGYDRGKPRQPCKQCHYDYHREKQWKRRDILDRYKSMKGCNQCGYKGNPLAMEFDHIDRSTKSFNIGSNILGNWEKVKVEVFKCQVLCGNCHNIRSNIQKRKRR